MAVSEPGQIPFPWSSFPGANPQESAGRLINCYAEPLGEQSNPSGPTLRVWRRSAGLSQHAMTAHTIYRGGLIVNNVSYEVWKDVATTIDSNGVETVLGVFLGQAQISIARNQKSPNPDVVAVDPNVGAYKLSGGVPTLYTGGGNLPQPNSVCFQDGYFFFSIGDGRCFASALNDLTQNALTFITAEAKADVTLLRAIPFNGLLWLFTTGSCEIWQDVATPAPGFPYNRSTVLEFGLIQSGAIAGFETGFSELLWVAQDFGVYWVTGGQTSPIKVSPPDLDRLIEAQVRSSATLSAGCYVFAGKKFWHLSSPSWTWEFNLQTQKWNERTSLSGGVYSRWRGTCGHPAFGRWLIGDQFSGNLLYIDDQNFTENGAFQLFRIESGPVRNFPAQIRVARADFDFDMGVGIAVRSLVMNVTGAAAGTGGVIRLAVNNTAGVNTNDAVNVSGVTGTTEANGAFRCTVIDATHIELQNTTFANAYISGGTAIDVTATSGMINPQTAISWSDDGGLNWGNPLLRSLGQQGRSKRVRASVKNTGLSGAMGRRWRVDVTDAVYVGLLGATQSTNPREIGT